MSRRLPRRSRAERHTVDVNPMMDIVFILLIFFIVTATFTVESGLDVEGAPPPRTQPVDQRESILIEIDARDEIRVEGRVTDFRRVGAVLLAALAESPETPVLIRSAPSATNGTFVRVLDQANGVGAGARILPSTSRTSLPVR